MAGMRSSAGGAVRVTADRLSLCSVFSYVHRTAEDKLCRNAFDVYYEKAQNLSGSGAFSCA